ncbi:MAG: cell division protein FtsL [Gammaproteobacteria bacterium]|nr:cell division protein FtsL [Gammaproteobacteria bacterium]
MKLQTFIIFGVLGAVVISAVEIVAAKHRARVLFSESQYLESVEDQLNQEWGQLLLEQGVWAAHRRIESVAVEELKMRVPQISDIKMVQ